MAIVLVLLLLLLHTTTTLMPIVCESGDREQRDCVKSYRAYCRGTKKTKIAPDAAPTPEAVVCAITIRVRCSF